METTTNIPTRRAELVTRARELGRALADETMCDSDAQALARARDAVNAEIAALDATQK